MIYELQSRGVDYCILWTSADEIRVRAILKHYGINNSFKKIFFSNKTNLLQDIEKLCRICKCTAKQLIFYEDNEDIIKKLKKLDLNVVSL